MAKRGPGGRFLSKREREALASTQTDSNDNDNTNQTEGTSNMSNVDTVEAEDFSIEFVDELPKVTRKVDSGVWVKRLSPLRDHPDQWAKVFGPTNSPHAQINNLRSGSAAGINPDEFDFAGRMIPTGATDAEGKEVKEGYVFARYVSDEDERAELKAKREARGDKVRAARAAAAE